MSVDLGLPIYVQCIGIPIAGTPVVTVIQARPEVRDVENVRVTPDDPVFPALTPSRHNSQGFYPSKLVEVIPSGMVRDQRVGESTNQSGAIQFGDKAIKDLHLCNVPY